MYPEGMGDERRVSGTYTVQEAAERMGLTVHTLRYYERAGLLAPPVRDGSSGHRRYTDDDLRRVQFLKRLRTTGMRIGEMQAFIALYAQGSATLGERQRLLEAQRCKVIAQIAELQDCLGTIDFKIASYIRLAAETEETEKGASVK
jgi:DNA-binding transcriptional MerR regulator